MALGAVAQVGGYPLGFVAAGIVAALGCVLLVAGSRRGRAPAGAGTLAR